MKKIVLASASWFFMSCVAIADSVTITAFQTDGSGSHSPAVWTNVPLDYGIRYQGVGWWTISAGERNGDFWVNIANNYPWNSTLQITITSQNDAFPTEFGQLSAEFTSSLPQGWSVNEWVSLNSTIANATPLISFSGPGIVDYTGIQNL